MKAPILRQTYCMKKILLLSTVLLGVASAAHAGGVRFNIGVGIPLPGVAVASPAPVYAAPAPVYAAPAPVYAAPAPVYAAPTYYAPAPVVVSPPSVYVGFGSGCYGYSHRP